MVFDIRDYGAVSDGTTKNTEAIQKTLDACRDAGGGQVLIADGTYLTGSIRLYSGTDLHIAAGATLLGSDNVNDYPEREGLHHVNTAFLPRYRNACLIFSEESQNISITGSGIIDCNGKHFTRPKETYAEKGGWKYERIDAPTPPRVVFFTGCQNVRVEEVSMVNQPAGWSYWIHDCDDVYFGKCKILAEVEYPNNDGIHINSCRNVLIEDCDIVTGDDSLIVRANNASLAENKVCENVTIRNCRLRSYSAGIRIGWINDGTIRNCEFYNLTMTDTTVGVGIVLPGRGETRLADEGREATHVENLVFRDIEMDGIYNHPIKIVVSEKECTKFDTICDLRFERIHSRGLEIFYIKGKPDNPVRNITFSDCVFEKVSDEELPGWRFHGAKDRRPGAPMVYAENIRLDNTSFMASSDLQPMAAKLIRP